MNAPGAELEGPQDVGAVPDPPGRDDGDVGLHLLGDETDHAGDGRGQGEGGVVDLLHGHGAQMPSGGRGLLDHEGVGPASVLLLPAPGDQAGGLGGADDGDQGHIRKVPRVLGEPEGQPGAGYDDVRPALRGRAHLGVIVGQRHHAVDGQHPALPRDGAGLGQYLLDDDGVGLKIIVFLYAKMRRVVAKSHARNRPYGTAPGHVACKVGSRDTYAHTSLNQGISRLMFPYL